MSLRPVEMQGSFPRAQTAGKIQEQLQQRGQVGQDIIANEHKKELDQKRKQVNKSDSSDPSKLEPDKENEKEKHQQQEPRKHKREKEREINVEHPYKGKYVDFSG
ncbi:hypothetical protein BTR23_05440 [Alkalihalophilus pseudofirmus]|uniref:hypothetical protein n=1 Tax=Alkalihalobacterium alkalinitrilicum TaxID=427920 RepID=UPI00094D9D01|nr:hypothetical protein [Alkalihalobacterium alkalinitrilicum]OLO40917.1 hypothetical protein BTR23_05440 [Alkalihalophilus pseudofirmus]